MPVLRRGHKALCLRGRGEPGRHTADGPRHIERQRALYLVGQIDTLGCWAEGAGARRVEPQGWGRDKNRSGWICAEILRRLRLLRMTIVEFSKIKKGGASCPAFLFLFWFYFSALEPLFYPEPRVCVLKLIQRQLVGRVRLRHGLQGLFGRLGVCLCLVCVYLGLRQRVVDQHRGLFGKDLCIAAAYSEHASLGAALVDYLAGFQHRQEGRVTGKHAELAFLSRGLHLLNIKGEESSLRSYYFE